MFVVRTSKPVENLWKNGFFWSRYSFVTHSLDRKPRHWGLARSAYSILLVDSNFKISTRVWSHDICLVFFFSFLNIYILQTSTHIFYCIRCILQVLTYVLCFQHVFTIGIILSATERHNQETRFLNQDACFFKSRRETTIFDQFCFREGLKPSTQVGIQGLKVLTALHDSCSSQIDWLGLRNLPSFHIAKENP